MTNEQKTIAEEQQKGGTAKQRKSKKEGQQNRTEVRKSLCQPQNCVCVCERSYAQAILALEPVADDTEYNKRNFWMTTKDM